MAAARTPSPELDLELDESLLAFESPEPEPEEDESEALVSELFEPESEPIDEAAAFKAWVASEQDRAHRLHRAAHDGRPKYA